MSDMTCKETLGSLGYCLRLLIEEGCDVLLRQRLVFLLFRTPHKVGVPLCSGHGFFSRNDRIVCLKQGLFDVGYIVYPSVSYVQHSIARLQQDDRSQDKHRDALACMASCYLLLGITKALVGFSPTKAFEYCSAIIILS
jgi:hypothetical protein